MQLHKHSFVRAITAFSLTVLFIIHSGVYAPVVKAESISDLKAQVTALKEEEEKNNIRLCELRKSMEQQHARCDELKEKIKLAHEADAKSYELLQLYAKNLRLLKEVQADEVEALVEADRIALEKAEADAAVDKWYEDYHTALEAANCNAGYVGTGSFVWPMPGYTVITCDYGSGHRGIDIAGSGIYGEPIVAADGGTVIFGGWMGTYGYCVFIDHGNGCTTRYAHASALACSVGDVVVPGQTIAYVGSTGNSTGPHLHFEVIHNGSLQNPFNYF